MVSITYDDKTYNIEPGTTTASPKGTFLDHIIHSPFYKQHISMCTISGEIDTNINLNHYGYVFDTDADIILTAFVSNKQLSGTDDLWSSFFNFLNFMGYIPLTTPELHDYMSNIYRAASYKIASKSLYCDDFFEIVPRAFFEQNLYVIPHDYNSYSRNAYLSDVSKKFRKEMNDNNIEPSIICSGRLSSYSTEQINNEFVSMCNVYRVYLTNQVNLGNISIDNVVAGVDKLFDELIFSKNKVKYVYAHYGRHKQQQTTYRFRNCTLHYYKNLPVLQESFARLVVSATTQRVHALGRLANPEGSVKNKTKIIQYVNNLIDIDYDLVFDRFIAVMLDNKLLSSSVATQVILRMLRHKGYCPKLMHSIYDMEQIP